MRYTVRPISDRTAFRGPEWRKTSPFTASWSKCIRDLDRELDFLAAENVVIEVDVEERHIRIDGMLRADAKATSPAVRLAFDSSEGPLTYATDVFERPSWRREGMREDWQHNLYAIVLGLEALRRVDRYGITQRGEQYQGFKQLGAGRAMPSSHMTSDEAAHTIRKYADHHGGDVDLAALLKRARFATHPDRHAGDRTAWDQVEEAAKVLRVIA
jgi:hypothetical protein